MTPELLEYTLIMVSNRGPVQYRIQDDELVASRGSGGLVTALTSLSHHMPFIWVASALGEGDIRAAEEAAPRPVRLAMGQNDLSIRYITSPETAYHKYYNVISNPFLWLLQHYMLDLTYDIIDESIYDAWENGYVLVNEALALGIIKEAVAGRSYLIMIQDYQLYLVGALVRQSLPHAVIQHFIHIPWPAPRYWALLPSHMRRAVLESLCSCDIVGFQTPRDAENFVATCQDLLPGATSDFRSMTVDFQGRKVHARSYPVSVDIDELQQARVSPRVKDYEDQLKSLTTDQTIVRVDRLDPTKNILRGFLAYEKLLIDHPQLLGNVTFIAFLVPSRTQIEQYKKYADAVFSTVARINDAFIFKDRRPIHLFYEENYHQALAGMSLADVLLVNPTIDGMNLVAKEGPIVNRHNAVMILSESIGAYEQLKEGAIPVSAADVEGTARALYQALTMKHEERARRSEILRNNIRHQDINFWLRHQLDDIKCLVADI